jgi:hypothetical protein
VRELRGEGSNQSSAQNSNRMRSGAFSLFRLARVFVLISAAAPTYPPHPEFRGDFPEAVIGRRSEASKKINTRDKCAAFFALGRRSAIERPRTFEAPRGGTKKDSAYSGKDVCGGLPVRGDGGDNIPCPPARKQMGRSSGRPRHSPLKRLGF